MDFIEGEVLYINKPLHWTSFDVVNKTRNILRHSLGVKKIKVGHAGTLDPLATGVMILCTGKATKTIDSYLHKDKEYIATIKLGATTPSFDAETEENATFSTTHITRELVENTLKNFIGDIDQVPPLYSAIRIDGTRAYELARKDKDVAIKPRKVRIDAIELLDFELPYIKIKIACSKGTYIRSLANDIGAALQSGGYVSSLQRTKVGDVTIDDCISIESFQDKIEQEKVVL
ncbi:MAG: tRNA pseudouridine(55) synthase TruB [Bacteroidales bacterium]|nr:tRNA pseudouridine(55) synthase TruB [Bacteroidales bacterium]MBR4690950.1 tRNA pseudouridine(55) synthase TruB [Bacteroidales bacterium]